MFTIRLVSKLVSPTEIDWEQDYNARIWLNMKKNEFEATLEKLKVYENIYSAFKKKFQFPRQTDTP